VLHFRRERLALGVWDRPLPAWPVLRAVFAGRSPLAPCIRACSVALAKKKQPFGSAYLPLLSTSPPLLPLPHPHLCSPACTHRRTRPTQWTVNGSGRLREGAASFLRHAGPLDVSSSSVPDPPQDAVALAAAAAAARNSSSSSTRERVRRRRC